MMPSLLKPTSTSTSLSSMDSTVPRTISPSPIERSDSSYCPNICLALFEREFVLVVGVERDEGKRGRPPRLRGPGLGCCSVVSSMS